MTRSKGDPVDGAGAWHKTPHWVRHKLALVSWDAECVWWKLSSWCAASNATGGDRGRVQLVELWPALDRKIPEARARKAVDELARKGVDLVSVSTTVIDLGDWWRAENPGPEVWGDPVTRARWARDKRLKRDTELCERIKQRDNHRCRYCGRRTNWKDKTGELGGSYDHVDPDGDNSFDNVVVACRACNGSDRFRHGKRDRTPEQWIADEPLRGRTLKRPGTTEDQAEAIDRARWERNAAG